MSILYEQDITLDYVRARDRSLIDIDTCQTHLTRVHAHTH